MQPTPDYYDLLGIEPDASDADIRAGHMRATSYWHPDRNKSPDALSMMQQVNAARDTLLNPTRKRSYNDSSLVYQEWRKRSGRAGDSKANRTRTTTGNTSSSSRKKPPPNAGSSSRKKPPPNAGSSSGSNTPPRPPASSKHGGSTFDTNIPLIVVI
jgi:curved DNA-binding protein CbpA